MFGRSVFFSIAALALGGCAISPLPENVAGPENRTTLIAHHVRCEARAAIARAIIDYFKKQRLLDIAEDLESRVPLNQLHEQLKLVPPRVRAKVEQYERAAISYDFTFNITEKNKTTAGVDFVNLVTRGTVTLGGSGTADLQRQGIRIFRITESFRDLIMMREDRCPSQRRPENFVYPITGAIGLDEYVKTFVDLNEFQSLGGPKDNSRVPTIVHTFAFTTTFSGNAGAGLTLAPLNNRFNVSGAELTHDSARIDLHTVIIGLSLAPQKGDPAPAALLLSNRPAGVQPNAKQLSSEAVDNAISRTIINRLSAPGF